MASVRKASRLSTFRADGRPVTPTLLDRNLDNIEALFESQAREYRGLVQTLYAANYAAARLISGERAGQSLLVGGRLTSSDGGGGTFVWRVGSVTPNNGTTLAGPVGSGGYWERVKGVVTPEMFGAVGDGVTDDHVVLNDALSAVDVLTLTPGKVYNCVNYLTGVLTLLFNKAIIGNGATLLNTRIYIPPGYTGARLSNFKMLDDTNNHNAYFFDLWGMDWIWDGVDFTKSPAAGGYIGYTRGTASNWSFRRCSSVGSNGYFIMGSNWTFSDCNIEGVGDDAYVIKAPDGVGGGSCFSGTITGGRVKRCASVLSIGSEVGSAGVASTPGTHFARSVAVTGVVAEDVTHLLFIKPGAIGFDFRNGLVEDIVVNGCTVLDRTGVAFQGAINILAGYESVVRNIRATNNIIRARCFTDTAPRYGLLRVGVNNLGNESTIKDVYISNMSCVDIYDGAPLSGSEPGYPIDIGVVVENQLDGFGVIENINVERCFIRGCKRFGAYLGRDLDGALSIVDTQFEKVCVFNTSAALDAGIWSYSNDMEFLRNTVQTDNGDPIGNSVTLLDIEYDAEVVTCFYGTVAATVALNKVVWQAPVNCYIWKIELANTVAITQSDVNYCTFEARNMTANAIFATCTTKVTGGINITASAPVSMTGAVSITDADAYLTKGDLVRFEKTDTLAGQPTQDMAIVIHYIQY